MIEAIDLTKKYGEKVALDRLNLNIAPGEVFCLLGQNGAGKTTTINLFLGFAEATSGYAKINGLRVDEHTLETKKHLAYIPESVMLYSNLSGLENLDYFSRLAGFRYTDGKLGEFLEDAGLQGDAHTRHVETYSKGMRQKVAIAIALAKNAKALLLDEPTSGLDPKASNDFSVILKSLASREVAVLMATHDIFRAKDVGSRIGIMREGQLVAVHAATELTALELEKVYLETV